MNIVDSSGWLEYFADTRRAKYFARSIEQSSKLIVPSITLFEVFKKTLTMYNEIQALRFIAQMQKGRVVELSSELALMAASSSVEHHLPMADSIILATALQYDAVIWTQDSDFRGLPRVKYFPRSKKRA